PPLQAGHRGVPRAPRTGLPGGGVAAGRAGVLHGERRQQPALSRQGTRPLLQQPQRPPLHGQGRADRRRGGGDRLHRHRAWRRRPVMLAAQTRAQIERARDRYPQPRSAILPSLWAVQHELGWLPPEAMAEVAEILGLAPSEVQAVSTFYSMYFQKPQGRHHILVCMNAACALRGADETVAYM